MRKVLILISFLLLSISSMANGFLEVLDISLDQEDDQRFLVLPVAFYTEITNFSYGAFGVSRNYGKKV